MKIIVMRKIKQDGGFRRWLTYDFAADSYGLWLYSPKGTIHQGHTVDGKVMEVEVGQGNRAEGLAVMHLIPKRAWWVAWWYELDGVGRIAVDICTPPTMVDDEWSYVDLELDLHWSSDGVVGIDDEDEFVAACESGSITSDEAIQARSAATDLVGWMRDGVEPFGCVGWNRFEEGLRSALAPIRTFPSVPTA